MPSCSSAIVVGGGINGIVNAILLARRGFKVKILESSKFVGGQFKDIVINNFRCDKGLYIPQLTGISDVDQILMSSCPVSVREGVHKDIAGHFLNGQHIEATQFPDLRYCFNTKAQEIEAHKSFESTVLGTLPTEIKADQSLQDYFSKRFGSYLANSLFSGICKKFWRLDLNELSSNALKIVHLQRIVAYDFEKTLSVKCESELFDSILSFPDQLQVPASFLSNKTPSIYPKDYGLYHLLDGLLGQCEEFGIDILTNTTVTGLNHANGKLASVECNTDSIINYLDCDLLVWCAGGYSLAQLYGYQATSSLSAHPPIDHMTAYVFTTVKPNVDSVYWSWDYDSNNIIRVSFPFNYSQLEHSCNCYLLKVEFHLPRKGEPPIDAHYIHQYLVGRGIIKSFQIEHIAISTATKRKFFIPSLQNLQTEHNLLDFVVSAVPSNVVHSSNKISENIFYLNDLLQDSYARLSAVM